MCVPHAFCVCVPALAYVSLFCIYVLPGENNINARYNGPAEECHRVTQKTKLRFTWHLVAEGFNETCDVQLTCQKTVQRGVHLPKAWKSKWSLGAEVFSVDTFAHDAVQRVRGEFSLSVDVKLDCRPSFKQNIHTHTCTHMDGQGDNTLVDNRRANKLYLASGSAKSRPLAKW